MSYAYIQGAFVFFRGVGAHDFVFYDFSFGVKSRWLQKKAWCVRFRRLYYCTISKVLIGSLPA